MGTRGEGADLVVTNLDQDPRPEMILMAYDAPQGANNFRYKVGWNLGMDGKTMQWSRMTQIEGVGSVGDGAGLALADLDGNGYPEMVLMAYDNPDGGNSFRYRIGWDLRLEW